MIINILFWILALIPATQNADQFPTLNGMDSQDHKVVMQVTQADSVNQLAVVGQIQNLLKALPNVQIEVVCHSQGLPLLISSQSIVKSNISELQKKGVVFAACENTMRKNKVEKSELIPGTITVPSGLGEIILKQEEGWTYIKAGI